MAVAIPFIIDAGLSLGVSVGTTLAVTGAIGTAVSVIGAASAIGGLVGQHNANTAATNANLSAANANAQINNANADIAEQNAQQAATSAAAQANQDRLATQRRISTIQGSFAKGGVITNNGSGLLDILDQAGQGEYQAQEDLYAGRLQTNADQNQANIYRSKAAYNGIQGQNAVTAGSINNTTSLLNGVPKIISATSTLSNLVS